jgi:hypothetical protein
MSFLHQERMRGACAVLKRRGTQAGDRAGRQNTLLLMDSSHLGLGTADTEA